VKKTISIWSIPIIPLDMSMPWLEEVDEGMLILVIDMAALVDAGIDMELMSIVREAVAQGADWRLMVAERLNEGRWMLSTG
jgi:hypothetical protein